MRISWRLCQVFKVASLEMTATVTVHGNVGLEQTPLKEQGSKRNKLATDAVHLKYLNSVVNLRS